MSFGQQLQTARKNCGLTQKQLGDAVEASKSTITSWETGARQPDIPMIKRLTQVLNVSAEFLLEIEKAPASAEAIHIDSTMRKYAQLDDFGKRAVTAVTDVEYERCRTAAVASEKPKQKYRSIDLYSLPASAGTGTFLDSDYSEPIDIPDTPEYARVTFAVAVSGDSMYPVFENGDYLLVEGRLSVEDGEIGVFILNGESFVKTFRRTEGDMPWLESVNERYEPIYIKTYDRIHCCGKVIGKL